MLALGESQSFCCLNRSLICEVDDLLICFENELMNLAVRGYGSEVKQSQGCHHPRCFSLSVGQKHQALSSSGSRSV